MTDLLIPLASPNPATTDWIPLGNTGSVPTTQPSVRVYNNATQSIPSGAVAIVAFNAVANDNGPSPHWVAGNPTRLTCQVAGTYAIFANAEWGAKPTQGQFGIRLNGANTIAITYFNDSTVDVRGWNVGCVYQLNV